jgi:hypothetical protein
MVASALEWPALAVVNFSGIGGDEMTRRFVALAVVAVALLSGAARGEKAEDAATAESELPIKRVVIFSSGVGYFQHQGKVEGDASVDLKFRVNNINDLLKSMVLEDRGGGQISTVTYGSRDPITKTLQTFSIDLTKSPTLGQLLSQIRGEQIEIDAPNKVVGTIIGVEKRREAAAEKQVVEVEYLNLLTDEGLRRIALDSVGRIKLSNPQLDAELRQALKVLAAGHATDKKTVTMKFLGQGEREVRVGYIQEAPVWKTSYRLVLDEKGKPFLQGWAIVENTTDTDWKDVRLSLVSGRPISFVMDLYSPLYATRPTIVPELFASLSPQMYEQDLAFHDGKQSPAGPEMEDRSSGLRERRLPMQKSIASGKAAKRQQARGAGGIGGGGGGFGGENGGGQAGGVGGAFPNFSADLSSNDSDFQSSVQAAAQGGDVGELFQYDIKDAVTLPRLRSAMLPIINDSVEGKKVSIYNEDVNAIHPLNGIELKNTSKLHLMQGPVTVFDGGVYAGDARIPDLSPGSERLLSYALDLDVEVAPTGDMRPQQLISARIDKGVLTAEYKQTRTQSFTVKNSGHNPKTVLIERTIEPQWSLLSPKKPTEKTRDKYRFAVVAMPKEKAELKIEEEQTFKQGVTIGDVNEDTMRIYLVANVISEPVKQALREVIRRKGELVDLNRRKTLLEQEIVTIDREQDRIRQNMQTIGKNNDLYNRYVKKFTDQEDQVEKHRDAIRELVGEITKAQQSLDEYLKGLKIS